MSAATSAAPAEQQVAMPQTFMVTWGVAEEFGGMTSVCLDRARMFQAHTGRPTPILTFEPKPGYGAVMAALAEGGHSFDGLQISNIYHHYRGLSLDDRAAVAGARRPGPADPRWSTREQLDDEGRLFCIVSSLPGTDTVVRREYTRPDGSAFLLDESPVDDEGKPIRRRLSLLTREQRVVGSWSRAGDFHRDWVRELAGAERTVLVVDSNFAAGIFTPFEEGHVVKLKVLHSSHVVAASDPFTGAIPGPHRPILDDPARWDGIVFLTEGQRADYVARFGEADNLFAISNPRERLEVAPPFEGRTPSRGAMVCKLSTLKNVASAIRIIARVREDVPEVCLDVYGGGPEHDNLQALVDELGLQGSVVLHGHTRQAARAFETAGFSLLTSRKEGQPLVLMESLGRGCPPVSFDIRYGPDSLIRDGVNGFLVPEGDLEAAAARIVRLGRDQELARSLSAAAWSSSEAFGERAIMEQWRAAVSSAFALKGERLHVRGATFAVSAMTFHGSGDLEIEGEVTWSQEAARRPTRSSRPTSSSGDARRARPSSCRPRCSRASPAGWRCGCG